MNPAFFIPGTTTTQRALSSRSCGIPLSKALIIAVSASAEASSLSSTLISLSAAKAAVLIEPANAKMATSVLRISTVLLFGFNQWQLSFQCPGSHINLAVFRGADLGVARDVCVTLEGSEIGTSYELRNGADLVGWIGPESDELKPPQRARLVR